MVRKYVQMFFGTAMLSACNVANAFPTGAGTCQVNEDGPVMQGPHTGHNKGRLAEGGFTVELEGELDNTILSDDPSDNRIYAIRAGDDTQLGEDFVIKIQAPDMDAFKGFLITLQAEGMAIYGSANSQTNEDIQPMTICDEGVLGVTHKDNGPKSSVEVTYNLDIPELINVPIMLGVTVMRQTVEYYFSSFNLIHATLPPTGEPTPSPSVTPSMKPTPAPTNIPSASPTFAPTSPPTQAPSTEQPTSSPTTTPTIRPTSSPTHVPSLTPTGSPTLAPTIAPTNIPSCSPMATNQEPATDKLIDVDDWEELGFSDKNLAELFASIATASTSQEARLAQIDLLSSQLCATAPPTRQPTVSPTEDTSMSMSFSVKDLMNEIDLEGGMDFGKDYNMNGGGGGRRRRMRRGKPAASKLQNQR